MNIAIIKNGRIGRMIDFVSSANENIVEKSARFLFLASDIKEQKK